MKPLLFYDIRIKNKRKEAKKERERDRDNKKKREAEKRAGEKKIEHSEFGPGFVKPIVTVD